MITIVQKPVTVQVCCSNAIGANLVQNEAFTATAAQTIFNLSDTPRTNGISIVTINTILQSIAQGDYTLDAENKLLTFSSGLSSGDKVAIMYEIL